MSGKRIIVETWCPGHEAYGFHNDGHELCLGGSGRTLTPGQYVLIEKVDGSWPADTVERIVKGVNRGGPRAIWYDTVPRLLDDLLDALSDHTEGTS